MRNNSHFQLGSGVFTCTSCKKQTRATGRGDNEHANLCARCYDLSGEANAVSDGAMTVGEFLRAYGPEASKKFLYTNLDELENLLRGSTTPAALLHETIDEAIVTESTSAKEKGNTMTTNSITVSNKPTDAQLKAALIDQGDIRGARPVIGAPTKTEKVAALKKANPKPVLVQPKGTKEKAKAAKPAATAKAPVKTTKTTKVAKPAETLTVKELVKLLADEKVQKNKKAIRARLRRLDANWKKHVAK